MERHFQTPPEGNAASILVRRFHRALTRNRAATDPASPDPRLRGRTYSVPFQTVWSAARGLVDGGLRGWRLLRADDETGVLEGEARTRMLRFVDDLEVRITLDADGQTRVDVTSSSRKGKADLGTNARRIARFLRRLDRSVKADRSAPP